MSAMLSKSGASYNHRISNPALLEGRFLEQQLPFKLFATLTVLRAHSAEMLKSRYLAWVRALRAEFQIPIGWVMAIEPYPRRHIHAGLVAHAALQDSTAERLWNQTTGMLHRDAAKVTAYRPGLDGMSYIMKLLDTQAEDVQFSDNLADFHIRSGPPALGKSSKDRRRSRRIAQSLR